MKTGQIATDFFEILAMTYISNDKIHRFKKYVELLSINT